MRRDRYSTIFITLGVALLLTLLPLPPALDALRPYWVALALVYWCLETQDLIRDEQVGWGDFEYRVQVYDDPSPDPKLMADIAAASGGATIDSPEGAIAALRDGVERASGQQVRVDVISNNIANANTAGFKKSEVSFEDLLYVTQVSPGLSVNGQGSAAPIGIQVGSGARLSGTTKVYSPGTLAITERPLDVAISLPSGE